MKEKEKRTERKTLPLTPSEFAAFTAAANASGLPLTAWLVQAAREKMAEEGIDKFLYNRAPAQKNDKES